MKSSKQLACCIMTTAALVALSFRSATAAIDTTNCEKLTADTTSQSKKFDMAKVTATNGKCVLHVTSATATDIITVQLQYIWGGLSCIGVDKDELTLSNIGENAEDKTFSTCSTYGNYPRSYNTKDGKVTLSMKTKGTGKLPRGFIITFQTVCGKTIKLGNATSQYLLSHKYPAEFTSNVCKPITIEAYKSSEHLLIHLEQALIGAGSSTNSRFDCSDSSYELTNLEPSAISNDATLKICGFSDNLEFITKSTTTKFTINMDTAKTTKKRYAIQYRSVPKLNGPYKSIDVFRWIRTHHIPMSCMAYGTEITVTPVIYTFRVGFDQTLDQSPGASSSCKTYFGLATGTYVTLAIEHLRLTDSTDCVEEALVIETNQFGGMKEAIRYCKSKPMKVFYVKSNYLSLTFQANWLGKAGTPHMPTVHAVKVCDVSTMIPTGHNYTYYTPNYPDEYENGFFCMSEYWPERPEHQKIQIQTIGAMELESSLDCNRDFLQIIYSYKDPEDGKPKVIDKGRMCGTIKDKNFAEWGKVTIIFRTDTKVNKKGGKFMIKNIKGANSIKAYSMLLIFSSLTVVFAWFYQN